MFVTKAITLPCYGEWKSLGHPLGIARGASEAGWVSPVLQNTCWHGGWWPGWRVATSSNTFLCALWSNGVWREQPFLFLQGYHLVLWGRE